VARFSRGQVVLTTVALVLSMALPVGAVAPDLGGRPGEPTDTPRYTLYAPARTAGEEALLILFPGGMVRAEQYADLVGALQRRSPQRLWVGVAKFTQELATPPEALARITEISAATRVAGFTALTPSRTFVAGHSLGGVMAALSVPNLPLGGLVLLGAYVPQEPGTPTFADYPIPVLEVAGEVDGRTRITRMARDLAAQREMARAQGRSVAGTKAVTVVVGGNHATFADGVPLTNDFPAEARLEDLHARIARDTTLFLSANHPDTPTGVRDRAVRQLAGRVEEAADLLDGFLTALGEEPAVACAAGQARLVALAPGDAGRLITVGSPVGDEASFAVARPSQQVEGDTVRVTVPARAVAEPFNGDQPTQPTSAREVGCKHRGQDAVLRDLPGAAAGPPPSCAHLNAATFAEALARLDAASRQRYEDGGRRVRFLPDAPAADAIAWQQVTFTSTVAPDGVVEMRSPVYAVPVDETSAEAGAHWCKGLSPARAMELLMVDARK
jgi:predicted esterase